MRSKQRVICTLILLPLIFIFLSFSSALAHFQAIIPSKDIVEQGSSRNISLDVIFLHPFEGNYMSIVKPDAFGVLLNGKKYNLLNKLTTITVGKGKRGYRCNYSIKRPGDYIFYVTPHPYFEPAEDKFIVHYTKVVVQAYGLESGWDSEVGLKTEIIPLTRPYGIWTGNIFRGVVKAFGQPVPYCDVEVEYYADGKIKPPAEAFVTQVIKTDRNGVFSYACPKAGWWAFAALNEDKKKMKYKDGRYYPVEIGAVIWIKVYDMPQQK
ncbi:MAG: DUF4198 domain-containing protein [Spirochaetes bacterium]|nr:MAG: DUF4198 domain-containing protein [Spirochaetota bacterium]